MDLTRESVYQAKEGLIRFNEMLNTLEEDIDILFRRINEDSSQIWKRAYVRAVFAQIEGVTFLLKQSALKATSFFGTKLSDKENAQIQEQSYDSKENGEIKPQPKPRFLKFQENIRFAFSVFAKVYSCSHELQIDSRGWQDLNKAYQLRNRLTHPKNIEELDVCGEEMNSVRNAHFWFIENLSELMGDVSENLEQLATELEKAVCGSDRT